MELEAGSIVFKNIKRSNYLLIQDLNHKIFENEEFIQGEIRFQVV